MFFEKNHNFTYVSSWIYSMKKCGINVSKMCKNILWVFCNDLSQSQPSKLLWFSYRPHPPPPPTYFRLPTCFFCFLGCRWDNWMGGLAPYKNSHGTLFRWIWSLTKRLAKCLVMTGIVLNRQDLLKTCSIIIDFFLAILTVFYSVMFHHVYRSGQIYMNRTHCPNGVLLLANRCRR